MKEIRPGIFTSGKRMYTRSLTGRKDYKETAVAEGKVLYTEWDPKRSKAAAAIAKGIDIGLRPGMRMLYLGIANGQTASHLSDILGPEGIIYGVEISERSIRDLLPVADSRKNIVPVLADARKPETFSWIEEVDIVFQDVATPDQSEILTRNCRQFMATGGHALLALKSRSIDITKSPAEIYRHESEKLAKGFRIVSKTELDPLEKDHMFFALEWKG